MAKKTKRKVSAVVTATPTPEVMDVTLEERPVAPSAPSTSRSYSRRSSIPVEFNPDYTYIVKDLKRVGLMAGTFFAILIILSFFIR